MLELETILEEKTKKGQSRNYDTGSGLNYTFSVGLEFTDFEKKKF